MSCQQGDYECVVDNCSGAVGPGAPLFSYWNSNNCPSAYAQMINTTDGLLEYSSESQAEAQRYVTKLFDTYFVTNELTDNVVSQDYNNFQDTLLNLCTDPRLPGICEEFLISYCENYTRDEVNNSPTLINFCGCYTPPDEDYLQYTLATEECNMGVTGCVSGCLPEEPGCTGQPACDPLCHRAMTSQRANTDNGVIITCPQTICVIDDVTINVISSTVPGGINFNTVCSGCGGGDGGSGCLCIIGGVNISSTMSDIGVGTNFNQFCGTNSICLIQDSAGNIISQGECQDADIEEIPPPTYRAYPNIIIVIIVILAIIIVFLMSLAIRNGQK